MGVIVLLILLSLAFKDTNTAIVAQVEPMKKAISYHKAIKILEIYVIPGQRVAPGDLLVRVERPDLLLDVERKQNELEQLRIERIVLQKKYEEEKKQLDIDREFKLEKLTAETEQLKLTVENNLKISSQFGNLAGYSDTSGNQEKSYYEIALEALTKEENFVVSQHAQAVSANFMIYQEELKLLEVLEDEREKELLSLMEEEAQLIRKSETHGTIGSISVQPGELLSPYSTILSIYELNPTVIKAIMNEGYRYDLAVGQVVKVESTNRLYKTEGVISEIGSRIIEYPARLRTNQNIPMWGRELFIKIPEQNNFLNGERVIVSLKKSRL